MGLLLRAGTVVHPESGTQAAMDVLIEQGRISRMGAPGSLEGRGHEVRDLAGLLVLPGLIDVHVHLREPGFGYKETIATGTRAAAAGGFTQVCCMPNTNPVTDTADVVRWIVESATQAGYISVHPIAAVTKGLRGEELTDFTALAEAGAVAFSDDGRGIQSAGMMKAALVQAGRLGMPIAVHAEDESLSAHGHLHDGDVARQLGIAGIATEAETAMIARDILLSEATGAHVHMCHVSPETAVAAIREGKRRGIRVTAEVTPHHLLLTEAEVLRVGSAAKVNPPLRHERDRRACVEGFLDGTLDIVATDHAPHSPEEKARPLVEAPFGFTGLEISFPLLFTAFVHSGILTVAELAARMSWLPAKLFHLEGGSVAVGMPADLVVIDPTEARVVTPETFASLGKTTPFAGRTLYGWPVATLHQGRFVYPE